MPRHRLWTLFSLLVLLVVSACASSPDLKSTPDPNLPPSPTPFQPGADSSSPAPTFDSQNIATFTPYPLTVPRNGTYPTPQVSSSGDTPSVTIDPLTGLPPADPSLLQRRPLAIKIALYPRVVPIFGLSLVDVAFEYYIEWGDSRFIGVFYGQNAKQVGPVRSGRFFDEHVLRMYHAYYVFNNADPREQDYFYGSDFQKFLVPPGADGAACPPFFTFRYSKDVADVGHFEQYFDTTKFSACLANKKGADNSYPSLRSSFFSGQAPIGGIPVNRIYTRYSPNDYNYWEYDPASGRYLRYQQPNDLGDPVETYVPLMDNLTNQQVAADNVITLFVPYTFANANEQQDEIYHVNLIDSGNAFVFRNGVAIPARWFRTDINQPLLITNLDGSPIYLKPGQTFFQVIGITSTVLKNGADWRFEFHTP
ncbi:MAG TPA: DUF3048 C-terminal domain-containing protein [Anaerolineales bacterium]